MSHANCQHVFNAERPQDWDQHKCDHCGEKFHYADAAVMARSVYQQFDGLSFCSTNCLDAHKRQVPREQWDEEWVEDTSTKMDEYGYPDSCFDTYFEDYDERMQRGRWTGCLRDKV